jgi:microcystin-dependent protein
VAQPYLGEIRMFAGPYWPDGWLYCDGQLLPIAEHDALFALLQTSYGGDGVTNFALPDLRSRVPVHQGNGFAMGQATGDESVTLTTAQMPAHSHPLSGTGNNASTADPSNALPAVVPIFGVTPYGTDAPKTTLDSATVTVAGGSTPHDNIQPFTCVNFIIAIYGVFPDHA